MHMLSFLSPSVLCLKLILREDLTFHDDCRLNVFVVTLLVTINKIAPILLDV